VTQRHSPSALLPVKKGLATPAPLHLHQTITAATLPCAALQRKEVWVTSTHLQNIWEW